jgi:hypothetical protein
MVRKKRMKKPAFNSRPVFVVFALSRKGSA